MELELYCGVLCRPAGKVLNIAKSKMIAAEANTRDIQGPRGGRWTAHSVLNVLARLWVA